MGDREVGEVMGFAAKMWWIGRGDIPPASPDEAFKILDMICDRFRSYRVSFAVDDLDYLDYRDPNAPLGRLLAVAFEIPPEAVEQTLIGSDDAIWFHQVECQFAERYNFL